MLRRQAAENFVDPWMQNLKGDHKKITKEVKSEVASDSNLTSEQQRAPPINFRPNAFFA